MPSKNQFRHQPYPTIPVQPPMFCRLQVADGEGTDFSWMHTALKVHKVVLVHGTFMGDDPFAISDTLTNVAAGVPPVRSMLNSLAATLRSGTKPVTDRVIGDVGNYTPEFRDRFQQLVGDDPNVELLNPTWSGQNRSLARADLAVRLFCRLADLRPQPDQRVLFWGHSHAGNGFAILSNLLANERSSVTRFFQAARLTDEHWRRAEQILKDAPGPHPWAQSVLMAAFGTPVRYGWDTTGYRSLLHILHHVSDGEQPAITTRPLFPPHSAADLVTAKFGDWVQAFGIAGTDTASKADAEVVRLLESGLAPPEDQPDTRFLMPERVRNLCARWKTGTRCHSDGQNLLVSYEPCGRKTALGLPIEQSIFGHGVATTLDWLPTHLALVMAHLKP
ncbi:MAG: hypothetical protein R3C59_02290 [Planctomycetaceae bacterium]